MDDKLPIAAPNYREDSFDTAVRGYNRQQVLEYMSRSSQLLASLEQKLAVARADVQRARSETERAEAEAERLRAAQIEAKPVHEEVSGRLSQILRLAAEEADQERALADEEITKLRADSQAESERLISEARAEAEQELAEARDTAERELAAARETAERELTDARARAEADVRTAQEEAERIRIASEQHSAALLDDAARRAGAVNEVSDQRLDTLTATHGEAVLRLGQIRDVLADLLDRDAAAGSLAEVVDAVMDPSPRVRAASRPELDTPQELDSGAETDSDQDADADQDADSGQEADAGHGSDTDAENDETSIVPPVEATAVHEPVTADEPAPANQLTETIEHHIDLREPTDVAPVERGVPTRR
jgi:F0F1-type ATP synthase membrane subunit b/b'